MSGLVTSLQTLRARAAVTYLMVLAVVRQRLTPLRAQPERGFSTLEVVLLAVAGVGFATLVILAIKAAIDKQIPSLG